MDNINIKEIYDAIKGEHAYYHLGIESHEAIKEIVEAVLRKGISMGLSLSTMTKEPFTSKAFQALKEGLIENVIKTQIDYGTD